MIEVTIDGIFLTQAQASGILLKENGSDRTLPIIIGEYEAQSIALGLENKKPPRPITHDLIIKLLDAANLTLERIVISELRNNTYYAILHLESAYDKLEVDSRPSDAIAIAVRLNAPIFVEEGVMDQAAYASAADGKKDIEKDFLAQSKESGIDKLKKELQSAVESEEYEKAAKIRDRIKQLEAKS